MNNLNNLNTEALNKLWFDCLHNQARAEDAHDFDKVSFFEDTMAEIDEILENRFEYGKKA